VFRKQLGHQRRDCAIKWSWQMKRFIWAVALALSPAVAVGQVTIGTDPAAHTEFWSRGAVAISIWQGFLAPASSMTSLSLWVDLGQTMPMSERWFGKVFIHGGDDFDSSEDVLYRYGLMPGDRGPLHLAFARPLSMVTGERYAFTIFFNNCGSGDDGLEEGVCPVAFGPTMSNPRVRFTTTDAYTGGAMFSDGKLQPNADIWFRATFDVPETEPLTLTASGAVALLVLGASRRRRTRG
jgi:hypothetical protein